LCYNCADDLQDKNMPTKINSRVLMSGADYFQVEELNPYSHQSDQPNIEQAKTEHANIRQAIENAGIEVVKIDAPAGCQDGIYTANWGLCRGNKVVLSSLPNRRQAETPFAEKALREIGKEIITPPYLFSGQGDALPCGNLLLAGTGYRTDPRVHSFLAEHLGYKVVSLQTVPELNDQGQPVINKVTGLPNSFFYDIDLAISVLTPELIAWCPEAFNEESQTKIQSLNLDKIEVSLDEAQNHFACNLISSGETVIMSSSAPKLKAAIEAHGLSVVTPEIMELAKGGGYIRCVTLSL
jgi:N-dimethylarginine dimethylaminohydrolase